MANPGYGVSIRSEEILNDSLQAQNDPQQRKDFFAKSLNVFTAAVKAYFDIEEFRRSDCKYNWTLAELCRLPIDWYGGADIALSKEEKLVEFEFVMEKDTDANTIMVVSMGKIDEQDTPLSMITLSDFTLEKVS